MSNPVSGSITGTQLISSGKNMTIYDRFIENLGIRRRQPSYEALAELVSAFLARIPFENISKLYYKLNDGLRGLPDFERYVSGIERYNFGGTCYTNNYYLYLLLLHLGYDTILCGADMCSPDVHMVVIVKIDEMEYLIDVGNAAPFLDPLPLDLNHDHIVEYGPDRYILTPRDERGRSAISVNRNGVLRHNYTVNPVPRNIKHFTEVIESSFGEKATFMHAILLTRFSRSESIKIRNISIMRVMATNFTVEKIADRDQLHGLINELFLIPKDIVEQELSGIGDFSDF